MGGTSNLAYLKLIDRTTIPCLDALKRRFSFHVKHHTICIIKNRGTFTFDTEIQQHRCIFECLYSIGQ